MFTSISAMVKALADSLKSLCDLFKQQKIQQSETAMLKDRRGLQEATDIAEEINCLYRDYLAYDSSFSNWLIALVFDYLSDSDKRICKKYIAKKERIIEKIKKLQRKFEKVN